MLESTFIKKLHVETPLTYKDVQNLVDFIKNVGDLEKSMMIYTKYGFSVLLDYKNSLIKKRDDGGCNHCSKFIHCKCTRIGLNGEVGICWMEESEGEY